MNSDGAALVEEINTLVDHIQKWMRQNHLLLQRSLDLMQRLVQEVFPQTKPKTYSRSGYISPVNPPPSKTGSMIPPLGSASPTK